MSGHFSIGWPLYNLLGLSILHSIRFFHLSGIVLAMYCSCNLDLIYPGTVTVES